MSDIELADMKDMHTLDKDLELLINKQSLFLNQRNRYFFSFNLFVYDLVCVVGQALREMKIFYENCRNKEEENEEKYWDKR